jgi:hypothetical protein
MFYEAEALRAGWSVRQLDRQIGSQFYESIALFKSKAAMLEKDLTGDCNKSVYGSRFDCGCPGKRTAGRREYVLATLSFDLPDVPGQTRSGFQRGPLASAT